jgi:predicted integral membrane protein DUF2269
MKAALVFLHVGSAVLLVGEILYSSLWLRSSLSRAEAGVSRYVLATMQATSRGIALPAMAVNLITGIVLIFTIDSRFTRAIWLILSIVLYTVLSGLWHGRLIPMRKKMAAMIEGAGSGPVPAEYPALAGQWVKISGTVVSLFAVILALMVWRPTLP